MSETEFVIHGGELIAKSWADRIARAQEETHVLIGGVAYALKPWTESEPCPDCGVIAGELHVEICDMDTCPKCGGQAISCGCEWDAHGGLH